MDFLVIWLVVKLFIDGNVYTLVDERQPDLATCWQEASVAMDKIVKTTGSYEVSVACQAEHPEKPA